MKRILLTATITLTLITAGLVSCSKKESKQAAPARDDAVTVTVAKVELLPMDRTIPVVGTLYPKDEATVSAEVEGRVEKTMAEFGDRLTAGQEIALIDTTTYEAQVRQTAASLAKAQASAANAEQTLRRIEELHKNGIASISDLDKAVADASQWRAEIKSVEATDAIAKLNLQRSHVRAPFDCAVGDRIATMGDYMRVGSPLFRVVNDGVLKYIVNAPERHAALVQKEQSVEFNVDAWPGLTFTGRVFLISPQVTAATRAFAFGALVPNPDRKLKASSFARGELILERDVQTPVVPLEAVVNFAGITKVFVVENGIARPREVQAGRIKNGRQEILAGVKPGETVATTGQTKLFEGSKVCVKENPKAE